MIVKIRSNEERSKLAKTMLYLVIGATALMLFTELWTMKLLIDIDSGTFYTLEDLSTYELVVQMVALLYLVALITCAVFFIMWFRRAYYNLHQIFKKGLKFSEGWAAGAWFVPIFNLFGPYQIATDLHEKTENILVENELTERKPMRHAIKGWWWALWIISGVFDRVGSSLTDGNSMFGGTVTSIIGSILSIVGAYLAIKMIQNYHEMEVLLPKLKNIRSSEVLDDQSDLLDAGM